MRRANDESTNARSARHGTNHRNTSNDESMRLLANIHPTLKEDQLREILEFALNIQDSATVAEHFRALLAVSRSGAVFGALVPPPGADIKSFDFDIHRVFYHPTYPPHLPNPGPFSWNFYIGERGRGIDSIIPDAHKLYEIKLLDMTGNWVVCYPMTVLPATRVRLSRQGSQVQELIFPLNPYESSPVIHHLPV